MDYDQFDAAYGQVLAGARSLDAAALESEVSRLRALAAGLESPADREAAGLLIASLDDALGRTQPYLSGEMAAAIRIQSRARAAGGTPEQRIGSVRAGIDDIAAIAQTADPAERGPILDLNELLHLLLDSLTSVGRGSARPESGDSEPRDSGFEGPGSSGSASDGAAAPSRPAADAAPSGSPSDGSASGAPGSGAPGAEGTGSSGTGSSGTGSSGTGSRSNGTGSNGTGSNGTGSDGVGSDGVGSGSVGSDGER